jgi:hypothetical protein
MAAVETVKVEHPDNPGQSMLINKSDFDPEVHKLYVEKPKGRAKLTADTGEGDAAKK